GLHQGSPAELDETVTLQLTERNLPHMPGTGRGGQLRVTLDQDAISQRQVVIERDRVLAVQKIEGRFREQVAVLDLLRRRLRRHLYTAAQPLGQARKEAANDDKVLRVCRHCSAACGERMWEPGTRCSV